MTAALVLIGSVVCAYSMYTSSVLSSHAVGFTSSPRQFLSVESGSLSSNEYSIDRLRAKVLRTEGRIRILLLTAHPDDESMFFGPTVLGLAHEYGKRGVEVEWYLHCLSKGVNCGEERRNELMSAGPVLGFGKDATSAEQRILVDDLPDGEDWRAHDVAIRLQRSVRRWNIDVVVTFDEYGVSGHKNHKSCHDGAKLLWHSATSSPPTSSAPPPSASASTTSSSPILELPQTLRAMYTLRSCSIFEKYLASLPFPYHIYALSSHTQFGNHESPLLIANPDPNRLHLAMQAHRSQYVWFRRLYIACSQLVFFNYLLPIS